MARITAQRIGGGRRGRQTRAAAALWLGLAWLGPQAARAREAAAPAPEPVVFRIRVTEPRAQVAEVKMTLPAIGPVVELLMPTWSPGFYRVEDHASRVSQMEARDERGAELVVARLAPNRWRVDTGAAQRATVSYRLLCDRRSVTTNWVSADLAVLNGPATFLGLPGSPRRPHELWIEGPPSWKRMATALAPARDALPGHYVAPDYDTLVDSPIVAGDLDIREFDVDGRPHQLVDVGERSGWDGDGAARDLQRMARAAQRFWGVSPFERYLFLNVFREGGGGLEHGASTLLTAHPARAPTADGYRRWLGLATHEYVHSWNVKRLRPVELGPFDYDAPPRTHSLWMSEGLTSYCADLVLARAGLRSREDFLDLLSAEISTLQKQPGRLRQTVEESSREVWANSFSGINPNADSVSYYVKGHLLAFLLDARIQGATEGQRSLDDLLRRAYALYSGARGFTAEEFEALAGEVAGADLGSWFQAALRSAGELDYAPALEWFGLRFAAPAEPAGDPFRLEVGPEATPAQARRLRSLLEERKDPGL